MIVAAASLFIKKSTPRKFIRAFQFKKYPGSLKPLGDISKQGEWIG
jgi:hypothetical protein